MCYTIAPEINSVMQYTPTNRCVIKLKYYCASDLGYARMRSDV